MINVDIRTECEVIMEILGWLVIVIFTAWISLIYLLVAFNCLGKYNIGGVPNKFWPKPLIISALIPLAMAWGKVWSLAPFTVILK